MTSNIVDKRSELIFIYDVEMNNPNGDPLDDNRPRFDDDTKQNLVTADRLKRTIRDYLFSNGEKILIREVKDGKGSKNKEKLLENDKIKKVEDELKNNYVDMRLFGATITITEKEAKKATGGSISFNGPVQFKFAKSMNKVNIREIGNSFITASKESGSGSLASKHIVDYSLINFYGIINEKAAQNTNLTNDDVKLMLKAMWCGTNDLATASKVGHTSRILLKINYQQEGFHIGEINKYLKIKDSGFEQEKNIKGIDDLEIEISELKNVLEKYNNKIESIEFIINDRVKFCLNNQSIECLVKEISSLGITCTEITFDSN